MKSEFSMDDFRKSRPYKEMLSKAKKEGWSAKRIGQVTQIKLANYKLKLLRQSRINTPALKYANQALSKRGAVPYFKASSDPKKLQKEFKKAQAFNLAPTSTKQGYEKWKESSAIKRMETIRLEAQEAKARGEDAWQSKVDPQFVLDFFDELGGSPDFSNVDSVAFMDEVASMVEAHGESKVRKAMELLDVFNNMPNNAQPGIQGVDMKKLADAQDILDFLNEYFKEMG